MLVDPEWLAARLQDPSVRVVDCTVGMVPQPVGASKVTSGREAWREGHIPGAAYLHMTEDLSAPRGEAMPYNLPPTEHMTALLQGLGVNRDTTLVLYGAGYPPAVTRAWWVLRASGVRDVRILDGGWRRWVAEGHPVSTEVPVFAPGDFSANPDPRLIADRETVREALDAAGVLLINALSAPQFHGTGGAHYGRPGRIPGSVSLPSAELIDPATRRYRSPEELRKMFAELGAFDHGRVIAYCGGGIAASATVFALALLGHPDVALYDASLLEWSADATLPMEAG